MPLAPRGAASYTARSRNRARTPPMTLSQYVLLGLLVVAAVIAGYFIGRWSALRETAARTSPLPNPTAFDTPAAPAQRAPEPSYRSDRGAPPPVTAGNAPPASAGAGATAPQASSPANTGTPPRRRGPPPPAAAGLMGTGDTSSGQT